MIGRLLGFGGGMVGRSSMMPIAIAVGAAALIAVCGVALQVLADARDKGRLEVQAGIHARAAEDSAESVNRLHASVEAQRGIILEFQSETEDARKDASAARRALQEARSRAAGDQWCRPGCLTRLGPPEAKE